MGVLVQVQAEDPSLSRWLLSAEQFGRSWEFSWLAKNLTPIRYQKVGALHILPPFVSMK